MEKEKHKGAGHRKRLRDRFLQSGLGGFLNYEIVELLLTLGGSIQDCKQQAKQAIKKFGGLRNALDAPPEELQQIKGIGPSSIFGLKLFQAISERYAKEKISKKIPLTSPKAVADYLRQKLGREKKENFVILSLDSRNNLIKDAIVSVGTLNANLVHPREVFKEAIDARAASVIVAHNHPSGDSEPSEDDLVITKRLVEAGKIMGIEINDHIIVGKTTYRSLKKDGVI
ncbi:MAG: DNA repair protein RadC [bacterium]|nr:DNA repair protein RadC [bacterium]